MIKRVMWAMAAAALGGAPAWAARPVDGGIGLQPAATPVMEQLHAFHDLLLVIIVAITALVMALLAIVIVRFNKKANPEPSKFTHNTMLEVIWTGVPVIILLVIAVPSFQLLYFQDRIPDADMTIKATGYQWYWEYEYPEDSNATGEFSFVANMLAEDEVEDPADYLLATDVPVVVPQGATVRVLVTAADVIHNWAMPAFGIKMDAIPGRLNETWFVVDETGTYYGQCSELCGRRHAYMPIQVEVVPAATYERWTAEMTRGDYDAAGRVVAEFKREAAAVRLADAR